MTSSKWWWYQGLQKYALKLYTKNYTFFRFGFSMVTWSLKTQESGLKQSSTRRHVDTLTRGRVRIFFTIITNSNCLWIMPNFERTKLAECRVRYKPMNWDRPLGLWIGVWVGETRHHSYQTYARTLQTDTKAATAMRHTLVSRTQRHMQTSIIEPICSKEMELQNQSMARKDDWDVIVVWTNTFTGTGCRRGNRSGNQLNMRSLYVAGSEGQRN